MGKKMKKFPFLFKATTETTTTTTSSWPWPTCADNPKTLSFRANNPNAKNICKTMNSADLGDKNAVEFAAELTPDSFLSLCSSFEHHHQEAYDLGLQPKDEEPEVVISRGLRSSDRLFFEPGETSSILEVAKNYDLFPYNESVAIMAMDSTDPFVDFRVSMEEMVAAHGLKDWEGLEELLTCYLRVNGKNNHGYIVGAFIDLLLNLDVASGSATCASASNECSSSEAVVDEQCSSSSTTIQYSFTSPLSFSSSTYSCIENEDETVVEKTVDSSSCSSSSSS